MRIHSCAQCPGAGPRGVNSAILWGVSRCAPALLLPPVDRSMPPGGSAVLGFWGVSCLGPALFFLEPPVFVSVRGRVCPFSCLPLLPVRRGAPDLAAELPGRGSGQALWPVVRVCWGVCVGWWVGRGGCGSSLRPFSPLFHPYLFSRL